MKRFLSFLWSVFSIAIITIAVLISALQITPLLLAGYEPEIEDWFQQKNLNVKMGGLSFRLNGYHPEIEIAGLQIDDEQQQPILQLDRATIHIDAYQSMMQQQLVFTHASLELKKARIPLAQKQNQAMPSLEQILASNMTQTLLSFDSISLNIEQLELVDEKQSHRLYRVGLNILAPQENIRIQLTANLYPQSGRQLRAQFELNKTAIVEQQKLKGQGYLNVDINQLEHIAALKHANIAGPLSLQQWYKFDDFNGLITTHVASNKLSVSHEKNTHDVKFKVQILNEFSPQSLQTTITSQQLQIDEQTFKPMTVSAQSLIKQGELVDNKIYTENLNLSDMNQAIAFVPKQKKLRKLLKKLAIKGNLRSVFIAMADLTKPSEISYQAIAEKIAWSSTKEIPSSKNLNIDVAGNLQHFNAKVSGQQVSVDLNQFYTQPFGIGSLTAEINGERLNNEILLNIPTIKATQGKALLNGRAIVRLEEGLSPFLFLRAQVNRADIKTVMPYLPQKLMGDDLIQWISTSIRDAKLDSADVLYSGRIENEVDFSQQNGVFYAQLNTRDVNLHYDPAWPSVQAKAATVWFKNLALEVEAEAASSEGLNGRDIRFSIENLLQTKASIALSVNGLVENQWRYLANTPIHPLIPFYDDVSDMKGAAQTDVDAQFYLEANKEDDVVFNVAVKTTTAGFSLQRFGVQLSELKGALKITENGILLKQAMAQWFNQPVSFSIESQGNQPTRIHLQGEALSVASLTQILPKDFLKPYLSGKSDWDIGLSIQTTEPQKPVVKIAAKSSLLGTQVHLPQPFSKPVEGAEAVKINIHVFDDNGVDLALNWEKGISLAAQLKLDDQEQYQLYGANLSLDGQQVKPSINEGISINGSIKELNVDHWLAYLKDEQSSSGQANEQASKNYLHQLNQVNLHVEQMQILGASAKNTRLIMNKGKLGLDGSIDSSIATGRFYIPVNQAADIPIKASFEVIDATFKSGSKNNEEPQYQTDQLPSVDFSAKKMVLNELEISDVAFRLATHVPNQFDLTSLSLRHNKITLNASGRWVVEEKTGEHSSYLFIDVSGKKFGQTLLELGVGDVIENGEIVFSSELFWDKPFWDLDFAVAEGEASLLIKDGYLKDIEPGGGRFVGLLSLSALPRRLTLDFSDFFKEGLEFDKINGDFSIHDGSLWTENLKMRGAVSDVKITGRTGIIDQDYDQLLTIIPQIRNTLPVISSLIAGSSAGWAMLLFQKLFEKPIDKSVTIKYKVSGKWDAPKLDLIKEPKPENNENEESAL